MNGKKNMPEFPELLLTPDDYAKAVDGLPDYMRFDGGAYADGLTWRSVQDERDGAGYMCYYVREGYEYRTEEERSKYAHRDFHDYELMLGSLAQWAKWLAVPGRTTMPFEPTMEELREGGFGIDEAE